MFTMRYAVQQSQRTIGRKTLITASLLAACWVVSALPTKAQNGQNGSGKSSAVLHIRVRVVPTVHHQPVSRAEAAKEAAVAYNVPVNTGQMEVTTKTSSVEIIDKDGTVKRVPLTTTTIVIP